MARRTGNFDLDNVHAHEIKGERPLATPNFHEWYVHIHEYDPNNSHEHNSIKIGWPHMGPSLLMENIVAH